MENINLRRILLKLGIYSNLEGYHYILAAVEILSKQQIHTNVTTLYQMIGDKVDKNPASIERSIRHSIKKSWKKGTLNKIYSSIPNNSVLLYDLNFNLDVIKQELDRS